MENLKTENNQETYVLYDRDRMNPGYFIITEEEGEIVQFIRLGTLSTNCTNSLPVFCMRGYHQQKCMPEWYAPSKIIDFTVENGHPLYESLYNLAKFLEERPLSTMDTLDQRKDTLSASVRKDTVTITMSKSPYKLKEATHFIDILLGDSYTCGFYNEILDFYRSLSSVSIGETSEKGIEKIISMK